MDNGSGCLYPLFFIVTRLLLECNLVVLGWKKDCEIIIIMQQKVQDRLASELNKHDRSLAFNSTQLFLNGIACMVRMKKYVPCLTQPQAIASMKRYCVVSNRNQHLSKFIEAV